MSDSGRIRDYMDICEKLSGDRAALLHALTKFVNAAKSWHDFHHGSETIQCDAICDCIAVGQAAIDSALLK